MLEDDVLGLALLLLLLVAVEQPALHIKTAKAKKIFTGDEEKPIIKKQPVDVKMKSLKIGEKLFAFGGYVISKFDDKNLMLSYKGLFQGYFAFDLQGLKAIIDKVGMGIVFKEPKVSFDAIIMAHFKKKWSYFSVLLILFLRNFLLILDFNDYYCYNIRKCRH